jgi:hypothetical protein
MTAHKIVIIECDECGTTSLAPGMILSDLIHLAVPAPSGVVDARHGAIAKGWSHSANGKDLCPNCGPARPPGKTRLLARLPHPHGWGHS